LNVKRIKFGESKERGGGEGTMRKSRLVMTGLWAGVLVFCGFGLNGCKKGAPGKSAGHTIPVGEVESMTGSEATFGTSTHAGIELAIREINANGGIGGKPIQLITLDDQGKPDEAAIAVQRLISEDRVVAILGEVASSRSLAMAPIADRNQVPMITPSSTNPEITKKDGVVRPYVFRVCFISPFQAKVAAVFAYRSLKARRAAILRDMRSDYSVDLAKDFQQDFTAMGGAIVEDESYSAGDSDFKSQLTAIRAAKPAAQVIFIPGYYTEVGLIARQARELGMQVPLVGGDGWDSPKLTEIGGAALNGSYYVNHYSQDDKSARVQDFVTQFKTANGGEVPDSLAAMGFDAARVLAGAMEKAKSLTPQDIRDAIALTKDFPGVTGKISINEDHDAVKPAMIQKVADGRVRYEATINP